MVKEDGKRRKNLMIEERRSWGGLILKGLVVAAACQSRRSNRACVQNGKSMKRPVIAVQNGPILLEERRKTATSA